MENSQLGNSAVIAPCLYVSGSYMYVRKHVRDAMESSRRTLLRSAGTGCLVAVASTAGCVGSGSDSAQTDVNVEGFDTPAPVVGESSEIKDETGQPESYEVEVRNTGISGRVVAGLFWTDDPAVGDDPPISDLMEVSLKTQSIQNGETRTISYDVSSLESPEGFYATVNPGNIRVTVVNKAESGSATIELEQDGSVVDSETFEIAADAERELTLQFEETGEDFEYGVTSRNDV